MKHWADIAWMAKAAFDAGEGEKSKWDRLEEWYLNEVVEQTWADSVGLGINGRKRGQAD